MATQQPQRVETELPVAPAPVPEKVKSFPKVQEETSVLPPVDDTTAHAAVPAPVPEKVDSFPKVREETSVLPPPPVDDTKARAAVPAPVPEKVESFPKVQEETTVLPPVDETEALAGVKKTPDSAVKKTSGGSHDRDVALAGMEKEKRLSFVKAWEENEKSKVLNKNEKKLAGVNSWENTQKAKIEAKLNKIEEDMDKKKAVYAEQMNNKTAMVHKEAEEKRAMVEAKRGEDLLKAEEMAAKHRATGHVPKKILGCFGG